LILLQNTLSVSSRPSNDGLQAAVKRLLMASATGERFSAPPYRDRSQRRQLLVCNATADKETDARG